MADSVTKVFPIDCTYTTWFFAFAFIHKNHTQVILDCKSVFREVDRQELTEVQQSLIDTECRAEALAEVARNWDHEAFGPFDSWEMAGRVGKFHVHRHIRGVRRG
jgi:hypothetical protein